MKKNEIALLILIVGAVALASYFTVKTLLGGGEPQVVSVDKAQPLSSTISDPAPNIFHDRAYNPTIKIKIGNQSNQQPFNGQ